MADTQTTNGNQNTNSNDLSTMAAAIADLAKLTAKPTESMQDIVEDYEENQDDFQAMYNAGGSFKQKLEAIASSWQKGGVEHEPGGRKERPVQAVEEIPASPEIENKPELAGYMEKVEKEAELSKPIVDDYTQQVLLKPAANQNPKVILPLTLEEEQAGLKSGIWESLRWLAEWCARQFKALKGRAEFKNRTTV